MLRLEPSTNVPAVNVDEGRMVQVLKNLVENAPRHTSKNGEVHLGVRGGDSAKMGLGLAICKALVQAQDGTITAESEGKGHGTKTVIRLEPQMR